jgi:UrcA family protein
MTKTTAFTTVLAAIAVLAAVPSAFAASPSETVTFKISTVGLNLRSPQDAQTMQRRIETAAGAVCGGAPYIADLDAKHQWQACVSHNVRQAMTQLHTSMVVQTASNGR